MNEKQLLENWNKLIEVINNNFSDIRKEKLLAMYEHFKDRMMFTPASGQEHFHNCHPGGYVEHVLNIINYSQQLKEIWSNNGANIDYTDE